MTATRTMPAKAVNSTAGVDGAATVSMNENLPPPPPVVRNGVSLFKWVVDMNMEEKPLKLLKCPCYDPFFSSLFFLSERESQQTPSCCFCFWFCVLIEREATLLAFVCLSLKSTTVKRERDKREEWERCCKWKEESALSLIIIMHRLFVGESFGLFTFIVRERDGPLKQSMAKVKRCRFEHNK